MVGLAVPPACHGRATVYSVVIVREGGRSSTPTKRDALEYWMPAFVTLKLLRVLLADPLPGLTAAEHAAEGAALDPQRIRTLHGDRGIVGPAAIGIVDVTGPS
jgi:hypothetical protein